MRQTERKQGLTERKKARWVGKGCSKKTEDRNTEDIFLLFFYFFCSLPSDAAAAAVVFLVRLWNALEHVICQLAAFRGLVLSFSLYAKQNCCIAEISLLEREAVQLLRLAEDNLVWYGEKGFGEWHSLAILNDYENFKHFCNNTFESTKTIHHRWYNWTCDIGTV